MIRAFRVYGTVGGILLCFGVVLGSPAAGHAQSNALGLGHVYDLGAVMSPGKGLGT